MPKLKVVSAGAAQGLVGALASELEAHSGWSIHCTFGPVGALAAKLKSGEAADIVVLTSASIQELQRKGLVTGDSARDIGVVMASVAIRTEDQAVRLDTSEDLVSAIRDADAIYLPDPEQATSGIHFSQVLSRLGIKDEVWERVRIFPSGAAAMKELASSEALRPIGCTQATEIVATPGVKVAGPLPRGLELATAYTAAITTGSREPEAAAAFLVRLCENEGQMLRRDLGFLSAKAARSTDL